MMVVMLTFDWDAEVDPPLGSGVAAPPLVLGSGLAAPVVFRAGLALVLLVSLGEGLLVGLGQYQGEVRL